MNRTGPSRALLGAVVALSAVACAVLIGVAIHELNYAADNPYRFGPAKVIATAAGAGALASLAVGLLAVALMRAEP
jgi:hypothetical protein